MTQAAKLAPDMAFSFLAIVNAHAKIDADFQLCDGTWVLRSVPLAFEEHWVTWIGSLRADKLRDANLVLLTQHRLPNYLRKVFFMLQLDGVAEYDEAESVLGYVNADGTTTVNQMGLLTKFWNTKGYTRTPIDVARIERASARAHALCRIEMMVAAEAYQRFIKGLNVLRDGLLREHGQDRNHQFVRSLEALIIPDEGQTTKNFTHRCQTFALANKQTRTILEEAYKMRSDTEHLQDWQRALQAQPAFDRENVAFQRTRQMEKLASASYARIFDDESLWAHFTDDNTLKAFWALPDHEKRRLWGEPCNLDNIALARKYDIHNRAMTQTV